MDVFQSIAGHFQLLAASQFCWIDSARWNMPLAVAVAEDWSTAPGKYASPFIWWVPWLYVVLDSSWFFCGKNLRTAQWSPYLYSYALSESRLKVSLSSWNRLVSTLGWCLLEPGVLPRPNPWSLTSHRGSCVASHRAGARSDTFVIGTTRGRMVELLVTEIQNSGAVFHWDLSNPVVFDGIFRSPSTRSGLYWNQ